MPCSGCWDLHGAKTNLKYFIKTLSGLFLSPHWLNLTLNPVRIPKTFPKSKNIAPIKQICNKSCKKKSETYNYTQSKWSTVRANDCSKVKLDGLVGPLNFISLVMTFVDPSAQRITDLLFQTNRSKHVTFKYWHLNYYYVRI